MYCIRGGLLEFSKRVRGRGSERERPRRRERESERTIEGNNMGEPQREQRQSETSQQRWEWPLSDKGVSGIGGHLKWNIIVFCNQKSQLSLQLLSHDCNLRSAVIIAVESKLTALTHSGNLNIGASMGALSCCHTPRLWCRFTYLRKKTDEDL
jgi:hypothetical protein